MGDELGLPGAVSMALGGMIGGGIYAVLGVVAQLTGTAIWAAFLGAGLVALCTGYSYTKLQEIDSSNRGGAVTFVQGFLGNSTLAGMMGWTLLVGYVGSMAMYAVAFAEFTLALPGVPDAAGGLPTLPVVSLLVLALFAGLNLRGARTTGTAENALVVLKILVLGAFGVLGLVYAVSFGPGSVDLGGARLAGFDPILAAALSFVAFQGWQLLFYDQDSMTSPETTIPRAVYISIPCAVLVYALVGVVTVTLVPEAIQTRPHVALEAAARVMVEPYGLSAAGGLVLALSALFSTGSAINATLFSSAHLADGMVENDLLPDRLDRSESGGVAGRIVVALASMAALFAVLGSLEAITAFASLAFIAIFGSMSSLAFAQRDRSTMHPLPPALGASGSFLFAALMLWHLYASERGTFVAVVVIALVVVLTELLYFERGAIEEEIEDVEGALGVDPDGSD